MKTILCSPENYVHVKNCTFAPGDGTPGMLVQVDRFIPTWKEYPRPKWWRRWFLREKQKPRERVFFVVDLPLPTGWSVDLRSPWMKLS